MTTPVLPDDRLRFTQPGRGLALILVVPVLLLWSILVFGPHHQGYHQRPFLYGVASVLMVAGLVFQWRACIVADRTGVFARTQLFRRNRRLEWAQVYQFELRGYWRGLGARTVDGQWVPLMIYGYYDGTAAKIWRQLENYRWQQQQALGLV